MEKTLAPDKAEITKFSNAVGNTNLVNATSTDCLEPTSNSDYGRRLNVECSIIIMRFEIKKPLWFNAPFLKVSLKDR